MSQAMEALTFQDPAGLFTGGAQACLLQQGGAAVAFTV